MELLTQKEAVVQSWNEFSRAKDAKTSLPGADMGIHDLNIAIGGHVRKKVTSIAGRSGMGKTALITPMFEAGKRVVGNKKPKFLFCTWEMPASEVVARSISFQTGMSWRTLFQATKLLNNEQVDLIKAAYKNAVDIDVTYQEMSTDISTIETISNQFAEKCAEEEALVDYEIVPVLIIDYVGMAKFTGSRELRTYAIGDFMNRCKGIAKKNNMHVIVLAQISRNADSKDLPDRVDLSDSQSIEQASDNLIILHRPEYQGNKTIIDPSTGLQVDATGKAMFRIMKGRSFGTGDLLVNCDIKANRFWSMDHLFEFNYWELYEDEAFWRSFFNL
jgi:replicative DNA helicase